MSTQEPSTAQRLERALALAREGRLQEEREKADRLRPLFSAFKARMSVLAALDRHHSIKGDGGTP
jgi:hypothetical protein